MDLAGGATSAHEQNQSDHSQSQLVLGDQLNRDSALFDNFDEKRDAVWIAEVAQEATHVRCHQLRIAFFFSAMRHFRDELEGKGRRVIYSEMPPHPSDDHGKSFGEVLAKDVHLHRPEKLVVVQPGDARVRESLERAAKKLKLSLEIREDTHFYDTIHGFKDWARDRKTLVLESYYRHMAMYRDAIDWASAPNTIGMSQFGDGGIVGTKPYCASGNYINRMSNYCKNCRYDPKMSIGDDSCPVTTFYWEFLGRNDEKIKNNRRMLFQVKNYEKKNSDDLSAISNRANELRKAFK